MASSTGTLPRLVLVTGANGYIASSLIKELLEQGYNVRGTVRDTINERNMTAALKAFPNASTHLELVSLDLTDGIDSFREAMKGVEWVMHVASPVSQTETDEDKMVRPAVEGTLSMLRAAHETPTVKKFVFTSSIAAVAAGHDAPYTEETWSNLDGPHITAYDKSKTLAEKAAWEFMDTHDTQFTLSSINPSFVLGPVPSEYITTSTEILSRSMTTGMPFRMFLPVVDIRNVVQAHIQAAKLPEAAGKRFILNQSDEGPFYLSDATKILAEEFNPMGYDIKTLVLPKGVVWLLSWFVKDLAVFYHLIDIYAYFDNTASKEILKINYVPAKVTILDGAHSMIAHGLIPKSPGYKAPA